MRTNSKTSKRRTAAHRPAERRSSLSAPSAELFALFGAARVAAGKSVTSTTALRSAATCAAVRVISECAGGLPIHIFRRGTDNKKERDTDHTAAAILSSNANPWTSSTQLRTALQVDALLHDNGGFAKVVRAGGKVKELHRLDPAAVTVEYADDGEPSYRVRLKGGGEWVLPYTDVVHIQTPGAAPGRPFCLIDAAREAIGVDLVMSEYQGLLFGNGARPSGILRVKKKLNEKAVESLKKSWAAAHGGSKGGGTAVLEDDTEWQAIALNLVDAQFVELRRLAIEEIARIFQVPLTLIGDLNRAVWRNVGELSQQFLTFGLSPWLEVWQSALERVLFTPEERKQYFLEFVTDDLIRTDLAARFTAYQAAVGGPWLVPNEVRAYDNLGPVDGGDALIRQAGQTDAGSNVTVKLDQPGVAA